ncbi:MAG TPA: oxaloacetate decarboxylase subunit alpha [Anaerolineae bacterium]|nr:oxaloacetate decarboxylase subunit alpha [Anaerolineae bacterium]
MSQAVKITDTCLRDAHQSLLATRMRTEHMLPIAEKLDCVGYHSLEAWGGATFDSCMRFLGEDPWERLRALRSALPNTPIQMLLRGQNILGYRHYPDDIVERFVTLAKKNGVDIFRIFDALNDVRNMAWAMQVTKRVGGHVQAAICYTISPVHSLDAFVQTAKELAALGADSICIKDMAGLLAPYPAYELVRRLKAEVGLPIQVHTHYTSGMGTATYLKAIEAGADIVDTAISTVALGTSQPPTETLVYTLQGGERDTGLDLKLLSEIATYFARARGEYAKYESGLPGVDVNVLMYQIPGGMLSNLVSQLRQQGAEDRYSDVLAEMPRVRADLGYPPLVTTTSQIVGTQATFNVLSGGRYQVVSQEVKNYVRGLYGRPPGEISPELKKLVLGEERPIQARPADLLEPGYEKARDEIGDLAQSEEDIIAYALFPQVAHEFFERRARGFEAEAPAAPAAAVVAGAAAAPQPPVSLWKLAARMERGR